MPSHNHAHLSGLIEDGDRHDFISTYDRTRASEKQYTSNTGGSQSHTHSISGTGTISGTTSATVNTVPSYYALAYIMKIR